MVRTIERNGGKRRSRDTALADAELERFSDIQKHVEAPSQLVDF